MAWQADDAKDHLTDIENVVGTAGNDALFGDGGDNRLEGGAGDDVISGGAGGDTLIGGEGKDTVSYQGNFGGVTVDLGTQTATGDGAAGDTLSGFENVAGSDFDDRLIGDIGQNTLTGGAGNDTLIGGAGGGADDNLTAGNHDAALLGWDGNDTLVGGSGDDVLVGDAGNDRLDGRDGEDVYIWGRGDGADIISANSNFAAQDALRIEENITAYDLWMERVNDHLRITRYGSGDSITLEQWFTGNSQVGQIELSNGDILQEPDILQIVQAAVGHTAPSMAGDTASLPSEVIAALEDLELEDEFA